MNGRTRGREEDGAEQKVLVDWFEDANGFDRP
jgi:hypothetical protein